MDKKQAVIIVSLLVLIVCTGVLATRAQSKFYVHTNEFTPAVVSDNDSNSDSSYFTEKKLLRSEENQRYEQTLKQIINDNTQSESARKTASDEYAQHTILSNKEVKVEDELKNEGFTDAICYIQEDSAKVIVPSKVTLDDATNKKIQQVILNIAQIRDISISKES